jgi:hypothetical protein
LIVQTDDDATAVLEAAGPAPDAFQVAPSSALSGLALGNTFFQLDGTMSVPGPDDFAAALSWNRTLGAGQFFGVALRREIRVPEPTASAGASAGLLVLLALLRRSAR